MEKTIVKVTKTNVHIKSQLSHSRKQYSIKIRNKFKTLFELDFINETSIDISNFEKGTYLIFLESASKTRISAFSV